MSAEAIAKRIQKEMHDIKTGTLRFWGVWFGRPYDNWHRALKAESIDDCLTVHFDEGEVLQVFQPSGEDIGPRQFVIQFATRVVWTWYSYGQPRSAEHLKTMEFANRGGSIDLVSSDGPPMEAPSPREAAVQIL